MPKNIWSSNEAESQFDPISSFLSEWSDPEAEEEEFRNDFFQGLSGRRRKAALVLTTIWGVTIGLHLWSWGSVVVIAFSVIVLLQALRLVLARPRPLPQWQQIDLDQAPVVSILVAAKNEQAVITRLVHSLCNLNYPQSKYEVWIIDDCSSDNTPEILAQLSQQYQQLKIVNRSADAQGGKSGALNQVISQTKGEIIGVFDADAQVDSNLLKQVVPLFDDADTGAVQVRKAIANQTDNVWTKGQAIEMLLDSYLQQQRIAVGGMGELRGNGQFVRRSALGRCGAWNEQTITDDLDLTIRLHLDGWNIDFLAAPAVGEEGVKGALSLWHQRNRWAEGGYQRYLDYWRWIVSRPLGWRKRLDLIYFVLMQYLLPTAAVPDLLMAIARHRLPLYSPLSSILFVVVFWGMIAGSLRSSKSSVSVKNLILIIANSIRGFIYMLHWMIVMPSITTRMSIRPKKLKWVKTVHVGNPEESFEF